MDTEVLPQQDALARPSPGDWPRELREATYFYRCGSRRWSGSHMAEPEDRLKETVTASSVCASPRRWTGAVCIVCRCVPGDGCSIFSSTTRSSCYAAITSGCASPVTINWRKLPRPACPRRPSRLR